MKAVAYYNEIDPKKAAWLRVLIKMNLIAPGDVDERDIQDVLPNELAGYTQCHFFAGVGIWSYALRRAGWSDDRQVWTGSCPCQPFSAAGQRAGFDDERHLWPAWFWLIQQSRPDVIFGEQVASKDGLAWLDVVQSDLEATSHTFAALDLCAAGFGAPHIRQRLFFVANSQNERYERDRRARGRRNGHANCAAVRRMADADGGNPSAEREQRGGEHGQQSENGRSGWMANPLRPGRPEGRPESGNGSTARSGEPCLLGDSASAGSLSGAHGRVHPREEGNGSWNGESERPSNTGKLGDTSRNGSRSLDWQSRSSARQKEQAGGSSLSDWMGNTGGEGLERRASEPGDDGTRLAPIERAGSATGGFWSNAEWIYCRDGKYRPTEPGLFPLAHGAPERMVRLRGYGDGIVAPVAEEFIRAYIENDCTK